VTLRSTIVVAALALIAATSSARAQSLENGAARGAATAPIAPLPSAAPAEGAAPSGAPQPLPLPPAPAVAGAPVRQTVVAPAKPAHVPLAKRWWFWAGLGAAAVGIVLGAIYLGPRAPYNGNANPGTIGVF
jgi:hypothetical protein